MDSVTYLKWCLLRSNSQVDGDNVSSPVEEDGESLRQPGLQQGAGGPITLQFVRSTLAYQLGNNTVIMLNDKVCKTCRYSWPG